MSKQPTTTDLEWTDLDKRAVDTARVLAMDAVQKVGNGHPGTAMSLAPAAYLLFQKVMRHDPADPDWIGRDRFVLSAGHSSLTLYTQLYFAGYGLELADLEAFRTWGSKTPGHPEYGHTTGVETTTGPLGQGVANAVGMAMAARYERGLFDPDAAAGASPFDHTIWAIAGDGCLQEGISAEASSLAGHQKLGNLVLLWDDNHISIEGDTEIAVSEDTVQRYEAYGWHVQRVAPLDERRPGPRGAVRRDAGRAGGDRPPVLHRGPLDHRLARPARAEHRRGARLGARRGRGRGHQGGARLRPGPALRGRRRGARAHPRGRRPRPRGHAPRGRSPSPRGAPPTPSAPRSFDRVDAGELPEGWEEHLPRVRGRQVAVATRAASGKVLQALGAVVPELWGGSADLAGSNNTTIDKNVVVPARRQPAAGRRSRTAAPCTSASASTRWPPIINGITLHGNTRVYGGTFLVFSDYMRNAVRLAALMHLPVTYVWTHDSIGLGEDGPTHQPVEHLASLRAIPGLNVVRPADANETAIAWREILRRWHQGVRQGRPARPGADPAGRADVRRRNEDAAQAAVTCCSRPRAARPQVILIGTGSEVQLAVEAREQLQAAGVPTRVVSMPCVEWFDEQDQAYRDSVLPPSVKARVAVEAGIGLTWHRFVGDAGRIVSLEHFGASADAKVLFREFGFTAEAVAAAARESLAAVDR